MYFQLQSDGIYRAIWIFDPYNIVTTLAYYPPGNAYAGMLQQITEQAGRWIQILYGPYNGNTVIASVTASNGQSVGYFYGVYAGVTGLASAKYYNEPDPAGGCYQAVYTYQADNTGAGYRPLLLSCDDPHFAGPMPRIRYQFAQGAQQVYGQIQAEIDDASGVAVSTLNQGSFTETRGDGPQSSLTFNSYLTSTRQDYDGVVTSYGYDGNGLVNSVTSRDAPTVYVNREPYAGKPVSVSRYDDNGQALTTTFSYGAGTPTNPYWLLQTTDPRGAATIYTRDGNHQVTRIDYPNGTYETFSYTGLGQVYSHRLTNGNVLWYYLDARGMLYQSTDNDNGTARFTTYFYDGCDRLARFCDFNGHNTYFSYNGRHQPTRVTHDDNTHRDFAYDRYGNRVTVTDELTNVTTTAYDKHRRPTSVTVPVNAGGVATRTVTFSYERGGDPTGNAHTHRGFGTMTLPSGKKFRRVYTGQGRLRSVTRGYQGPDATTDLYTYDGAGKPLTVVDANNITQATYTYDALGRKRTLTDANGHVTTWNYYAAGSGAYAGWPQSTVAPGSAVGTVSTTNYFTYDAMGRWLDATDASGQYSGQRYDANGRLSAVGDQNGVYSYGYDASSRVNSLGYPDGTTQTWTYDPAGNLVGYKNRNGDLKTIAYNNLNQATSASWSNNAAPGQSWAYDTTGRVTDQYNWYVGLHYTYDASGSPLSEYDYNAFVPGGAANTTTYSHDADGNVNGMGYPAGDQPPWAYDGQNRCLGLGTLGGVMFSHLYFQGERITGRALANNVASEYLVYQANNRVQEMWDHHGGSDPTASSWPASNITARRYGYAPDGQMTWADRQYDGGGSGSSLENNGGENYGYAPNGALSGFGILDLGTYQGANGQGDSAANPAFLTAGNGANGPGSYSGAYQYDWSGNRSQARQYGGASFGYGADALNRYGGSTYDGNGCTTNSAMGWTYVYNAEGQMTAATRQGDGYYLIFAYDGAGRLIYQADSARAKIFCYAGARRIEERSAANNASLYRYFFDSPTSDRITFRQQSNGQMYGGPRLYYQYDPIGNTSHVSDDGGNVVEQYLYDAYGTPYCYDRTGNTYLGQTGAQDNRYLFHVSSAYQWLAAPGLYYCRARMYLPTHGRWLQPDPIGFAGGDLNLYRYCGNDPVNRVDPSGKLVDFGTGNPTVDEGAVYAQWFSNMYDSFNISGEDWAQFTGQAIGYDVTIVVATAVVAPPAVVPTAVAATIGSVVAYPVGQASLAIYSGTKQMATGSNPLLIDTRPLGDNATDEGPNLDKLIIDTPTDPSTADVVVRDVPNNSDNPPAFDVVVRDIPDGGAPSASEGGLVDFGACGAGGPALIVEE